MKIPSTLLAFYLLSQHGTIAAKTAEEFLVEGLEEIVPAYGDFDGDMYAGLLPIDVDKEEVRGELMFWLFQPLQAAASDTLTIWLNGGPGCSSFKAGNLFETAPVTSPHYPAGYPKTSYDEPLVVNEWAWTKTTNMLFVEQPTGIGFSWGPGVNVEADLSKDFYNFLVIFYQTFPDMADKKLYIFGESYAGYYVPSIAHKIHKENINSDNPLTMNLSGIGIGNGWMDARVQGPAVIDYAWWHGMIDSTTRDGLHALWQECESGADMAPPFHKFTIPDECNIMGATLAAAGKGIFPDLSPNIYDVTTWDTYAILGDPRSTYHQFYNNPEVKKALHAPMDTEWVGCIPGAGRRLAEEPLPGEILLAHDKPESVIPYVAELLDEAGIRVLIYNGDRDLSTCSQGSETLLDGMKWKGAGNWTTAQRGLWTVDGKPAGYIKAHANLEFLVVYNSGHLVPANVPIPALDLITRFLTNQSFNDHDLPTFHRPQETVPADTSRGIASFHAFHIILNLVVAIVCLVCGFLAASYRERGRRNDYTRIGDAPGELQLPREKVNLY